MPVKLDPEGNEIRCLHDFVEIPGAQFLEIGCGDGRLTWKYAAVAQRVIGLDPDSVRLTNARLACPSELQAKVSFLQAHAETIPLPDASFDGIILAWSL